jgi:viologen exporter family transport system permease protein
MRRYLRLLGALSRFSLLRELAFRTNFLAKISVEVLWLGVLILFYKTVFGKTSNVAQWSEAEYLFFLGCYYALEGLIETLFLDNANEFADLVRSGDLDFFLLKPIDEQFLISCRNIDWSTAANVVMGSALMLIALVQLEWQFDLLRLMLFLLMFACGVALAYSFLLMLTSTSVWFMRNQSLYELWWLFTSLMRYPREIFNNSWALVIGRFFTFVVPVLIVVNIPANVMVRALDWRALAAMLVATTALLWLSRRVFRAALRRYRSASS